MDQNYVQQQLMLFKYLIESIQKQQETKAIDFSTKFTGQSSAINLLKEFSERLQQSQRHSIASKKDDKSHRSSPVAIDRIQDDDVYWERRKKNNVAAKRSRDARRTKEEEISLRAVLLEEENVKLRLENAHLKQENLQLRYRISPSTNF